jgi:hypothetical protein
VYVCTVQAQAKKAAKRLGSGSRKVYVCMYECMYTKKAAKLLGSGSRKVIKQCWYVRMYRSYSYSKSYGSGCGYGYGYG